MKAVALLFSKSFLITALLYGVMITLFEFSFGNGFDVFYILTTSVLLGLVMSFIFVALQIDQLQRLGVAEFSERTLSVDQEKTFLSKLTKQKVIERINIDPHFSKMKMTKTINGIILKTPISMKSFGEVITISIKGESNEQIELHITSKPKIKTTMVDLGKNFENVMRLYDLLNE